MGISALCRSSVAAMLRLCSSRAVCVAAASAAIASAASAQQLDTIYTGGNGLGAGAIVYFDLNVTTGITIRSLDVNLSSAAGTACTLDVYVTAVGGSFVGNTANAGAWTLVATGSGTAAGNNLHTPVDISDFTLNPGTYGVGVKYTGAGMNYTNGNGTTTPGSGANQTYTAPEFTLLAGCSQAAPFTGALNNPRVWNGTIYYVQSNPAATGACCTATAQCTFGTAAACQTSGGFFSGANTSCTPNVCPHRGACCSSTSTTCTFSSNGAAGCAFGSTYQGDATSCSPNICPPPPPPVNDECSGAIVVTASAPAATGTTVLATASGALTNTGTGSCTQAAFNTGTHLDVWYRFTPTATATYNIDTCGSAFDTVLSIHSGCPADQTNILDCNDDAIVSACSNSALNSRISSVALTAGQTYYIGVAGYNGASGVFTLNIGAVISGACCNSTSGACTTSLTGAAGCGAGTTYQGDNTVCATGTCPQEACCNNATGACTLAAAGACASGTTGQGSGSTCASVTCPAEACCNATTGACTLAGPGACASGTTGQGVGTSCTPTNPCPQPPPPANDVCGPTNPALSVGVSVNGTNVLATTDTTITGTLCPNGLTASGGTLDVFYRFTAPATTDFTIDTCGSGFDTVVSIHSDCPATEAGLLACNDDAATACTNSGVNSRIASVSLTAGTLYTVRVAGYNGATGAFTLTVNYVNPPTGGVCCRGATCNTTVVDAASCTSSLVPGQTAGATFVASLTACNTTGNTTTPCCYANYNKTGGISVQDIFDFLNDWFAGSAYANTGGTGAAGALSVQNIFDFLNAWFAGGCS